MMGFAFGTHGFVSCWLPLSLGQRLESELLLQKTLGLKLSHQDPLSWASLMGMASAITAAWEI